jgi:hypothetical protein
MENNMQMIDVLKRLAELDSNNPNIIKESTEVAECGMMGMGVPEAPKTPATINITASDGEELGSMLAAIMQLAGVQKVEPEQLGVQSEPMKLTAEPSMGGLEGGSPDDMRNVIDKLNPMDGDDDVSKSHGDLDNDGDHDMDDHDQEKTREEYDNSPSDPTKRNPYPKNSVGTPGTQDAAGNPGVGDRNDGRQPKAFPTFESLMSEYREFVSE